MKSKRLIPTELQGGYWLAPLTDNGALQLFSRRPADLPVDIKDIGSQMPTPHRSYCRVNSKFAMIVGRPQELILVGGEIHTLEVLVSQQQAIGTPYYSAVKDILFYCTHNPESYESSLEAIDMTTRERVNIFTTPGYILEFTPKPNGLEIAVIITTNHLIPRQSNQMLRLKDTGKWSVFKTYKKAKYFYSSPNFSPSGEYFCYTTTKMNASYLNIEHKYPTLSCKAAAPEGEWGNCQPTVPNSQLVFCGEKKIYTTLTHKAVTSMWEIDASNPGHPQVVSKTKNQDQVFEISAVGTQLEILKAHGHQSPTLNLIQTEKPDKPAVIGLKTYPQHIQTDIESLTTYSWFYGIKDKKKTPLIILIPNGPHSCSVPALAHKAHKFNQRGYAVCYINYPGSSGYGYNYEVAIRDKLDTLPSKCVKNTIINLKALGLVQPTAVIAWGGGIGGFITLQTMIQFPDLLTSAIAVYPILDLSDYYRNSSQQKKRHLEFLLGPFDSYTWKARSPLLQAAKIRQPLLLIQTKESKYSSIATGGKFYDNISEKSSCHYQIIGQKDTFKSEGDWQEYEKISSEFLKNRHKHSNEPFQST